MKTQRYDLVCRGFSLIEMVAAISMLSVLMLVIAATLWGAVKIERADSRAFHRMTVQAQLADQFREDVRQAVECPDSLNDMSAGPSCLILKVDEHRHVVYRWSDDRLTRAEFSDGAVKTLPLPVGGERISVIFGESAASDRIVWMRLLESRGAGPSRRDWPVEIRAAVGGDLR
jgi:prepilin-type N-terminal cleavage/methylation domain-containing protein